MRGKMVLGLTGSFGSGKTTVARMLTRLGAALIDVDKIYHRMIRRKGPVCEKIVSAFGEGILGKQNEISRKKLARLVFGQSRNLEKLSQITHPAIIKQMRLELLKLKGNKNRALIIIDAPLLLEAGLAKMVDRVIVVKASLNNQIKRMIKKRNLTFAQAKLIIKAQMPLNKKISLADYVIDNNGTLKQTRKQVKDVWQALG